MTENNKSAQAVQDLVRAMLDHPGVYIAGDTKTPDLTTVLVSRDGAVFSTKVDEQLDPERFLETLTLAGPYRASAREAVAVETIRAAFPAGPQREAAMLMHEQLEQLRGAVASYYISYLRYSFIEQLADRNPNGGIAGFLQWVAVNSCNAFQLNKAIDGFMKAATEKPAGVKQ